MDASRREFIRRMLAASILVGVGYVGIWALLESEFGAAQQQPVTLLQNSTTQQTTSVPGGSKATTQSTTQSAKQSTSQSTTQSTQSVPAGYVFVTGLAALSGKSSAYFNHPTGGVSLLLSLNGSWKAFNATCTHAPCTVGYSSSQIQCPCHGAVFDPSNGNVVSGPAPTRLPEYEVLIQANSLYVSNRIVN